MKQYCRYCSWACWQGDESFACCAPAPCGNNGGGILYDGKKAKRPNKCKAFDFNPIDIFRIDKMYKPRAKVEQQYEQIKMF